MELVLGRVVPEWSHGGTAQWLVCHISNIER